MCIGTHSELEDHESGSYKGGEVPEDPALCLPRERLSHAGGLHTGQYAKPRLRVRHLGADEGKMKMDHAMQTLITYGSRYGSAEHYAQKFAECAGLPVLSYREAESAAGYDCVIHFGALYAGGVLGLRQIVSLLPPKAELIIVTVGLADVQDAENIQNIRNAIRLQIPEDIFGRVQIFHLRGAIDYGKLNLKHRTMMALLYAKAKELPEEKKNAETRAMIETYGKQVSFVDDAAVIELINSIYHKEPTGMGE